MIYLDNAATSFPKPRGMTEAMVDHLNAWCGNPGRSGHMFSKRTGEAVYRTRSSIAELIGAKNPERILFTSNTTGALNQAIQGVLQPGNHVVTTAMEHNSVLRPLVTLGCRVTVVPCNEDGSLESEDIERKLQKDTKMVLCTCASNVTGTRMPIDQIAEICRKRKVMFLVDAAQAVGHLPVKVGNIDLLAAPGHKGLMGPMGTGFLYVAENVTLRPLLQGGTGTLSKQLRPTIEFPDSFEAGTINAPGIIGLGTSVSLIREIGVDAIWEHQRGLISWLDEMLRNMEGVVVYGPKDSSKKVGIVTFNIKGWNCEEVALRLNDEFGIAVRAGFHCAPLAHKTIGTWETGAVRVSVGWFNTMRQMAYLCDAIAKISGAHPSQYLPTHLHGCSVR